MNSRGVPATRDGVSFVELYVYRRARLGAPVWSMMARLSGISDPPAPEVVALEVGAQAPG